VAHDWLELGMMSNLGLQNPAVHILHGNYDYYYELAKKHADSIDRFICVSLVIYKKLLALLPGRKNDIHYCRFPVPAIQFKEKENKFFSLFYCARSLDSENKQFQILPKINAELKSKGLHVEWTIIGEGISSDEVKKMMDQYEDISIYQRLDNQEVLTSLQGHHLFILPSLKEGFPVAVVEAMKAGLVPLVTDWEGATAELIVEGETGFYVEPGNATGYANIIETLNGDRKLLKRIAESGRQRANELFDPGKNTVALENVFLRAGQSGTKDKNKKKVYGSRLDNPIIPNVVTQFIRRSNNARKHEAKN
jgi:glycosyltransferase involved in cell wall biosynthesis